MYRTTYIQRNDHEPGYIYLMEAAIKTTNAIGGAKTMDSEKAKCPHCKEQIAYRNGKNKLRNGEIVQKWYCPQCDRTFQKR